MEFEPVKAIGLTTKDEPDVMALINEFASLRPPLSPTTALKQHLLETLPAKIAELKKLKEASAGVVNDISNGKISQG